MTTPMQDIEKYVRAQMRKYQHRLIAYLEYIGEEVVNGIRTGKYSYWMDHSGNLRSSIGYMVVDNGKVVAGGGFEPVTVTETKADGTTVTHVGEEGSEKGIAFIGSLASEYAEGTALVVVAGMNYASYVERHENHPVLAKGELEARKLIRDMINELSRMN